MTSALIRVRRLFGTRAIACLLFAAPATGCTSWHPLVLPTPGDGASTAPTYWTSRARVILTRGDTVVLTRVLIARDSVVGTGVDGNLRRFARRDVVSMDRRNVNAMGTVFVTILGTIVAFSVLLVATAAWLSLD